jgi:hypothetical protein
MKFGIRTARTLDTTLNVTSLTLASIAVTLDVALRSFNINLSRVVVTVETTDKTL